MKTILSILLLTLFQPSLFSQVKTDSSHGTIYSNPKSQPKTSKSISSFPLMFNVSTIFNTVHDLRMNNFLSKYQYTPPRNIPIGIRFEIAGMPVGGRFLFSLN